MQTSERARLFARAVFWIALAVTLVSPRVALGQVTAGPLGSGFDVDRLIPAPAGDRFQYVAQPRIRESECPIAKAGDGSQGKYRLLPCWTAARVFATYQSKALRFDQYSYGSGQPKKTSLDLDTSRLHLGFSWAPFSAIQVSLDIPLVLHQTDLASRLNAGGFYGVPSDGTRIGRSPQPFDVGDVRLGYRVSTRLGGRFRWGLQSYVYLMTGDRERLTGDRFFHLDMFLMAGFEQVPLSSGWVLHGSLNGGFSSRPELSSKSASRVSGYSAFALAFEYENAVQLTPEFRAIELALDWRAAIDASVGARVNWWPSHRSGSIWTGGTCTLGLTAAYGVPAFACGADLSLIPWWG